MRKFLVLSLAFAALLAVALDADAGPFGRFGRSRAGSCANGQCEIQQIEKTVIEKTTTTKTTVAVTDALAEVNAERSRRGLRPYILCEKLTAAAKAAAAFRAERRIHGHTQNDFAFLPVGSNCNVAGCGALEPSWGWGTCCTFDNYTYAGAALVMGNDGRRYMHLFVR